MKPTAINLGNSQNLLRTSNTQNINSNTKKSSNINYCQVSFCGNPNKKPEQIAAFATESNFIGGIYKTGGLGDVAEALPEAMAEHGKEITGKNIDFRTFLPYYSFDNSDGKLYVAPKDIATLIKENKPFTYKDENNNIINVKAVDSNYQLQNGESFVLITESKDGKTVNKAFVLDDMKIDGEVKRMSKDSFDMEKVPYKIFKLDTPTRKDTTYLIYTPEMASGKAAYGIYQKYRSNKTEGTTAYGGSSAYGGKIPASALKTGQFVLSGNEHGDMFYTEQVRAMQNALEELSKNKKDNFNPQNIMLHDRFGYVFISDAMQKAKDGNEYYKGMRFVPVFHNIGRSYQGAYSNPVDFFRVIATEKDLETLKSDPNFAKIQKISEDIAEGKATKESSSKIYNFFKAYFPNLTDSEGTFNMTMIATAATKSQPDNCVPGNVSKNFGLETRDFATEDISKGLTAELKSIANSTVDVVNGSKPANMAIDKQDGFFGTGTLNSIFKDTNDERHYRPYSVKDTPDTIYSAKKSNKENLINIVAEATKNIDEDPDAIAKVFFGDAKRKAIRQGDSELSLTLGGFSEYSEGDILFTTWGRPDPQKGLVTTLRAFKKTLQDESIPLETRKHLKLIMGAGGGNDAFRGNNPEWIKIQQEMEEIAEIEDGAFKNNALYVNGLFPNRIANCADLAVFTSRFEPCGITPLESYAAGTPVLSIKTGGAPDFVQEGKTGLLTKNPFMLSATELNLSRNVDDDSLDKARIEHSSIEVAGKIKEFLSTLDNGNFEEQQKQYIQNCMAQKVEWHNNSTYNQGRNALDIYANDKFRTQDNEVSTEAKTSLRGEFDDSVFGIKKENKEEETPAFMKDKKESKTDTAKKVGGFATLLTLIFSGWLFIKSKIATKQEKTSDKQYNQKSYTVTKYTA